jgi:hypothetical protein
VRRWRIKAPNRWGEKLGAPRMSLTVKLFRAGFEPLRGSTTPSGLERPENDHILGDATRTHGSNPARSSQRSGIRFPAPRFSPWYGAFHRPHTWWGEGLPRRRLGEGGLPE